VPDDEARCVRRQKQRRGGDLCALAVPADRDAVKVGLAGRLSVRPTALVGVDRPRCDGVDADAQGRELDGHHFGQKDHTGFGDPVSRTALAPALTRDRRHVDDRPRPLPDHHLGSGLGAEKRPGQVHPQLLLPLARGGREERLVQSDTRVVDQHVEPAEMDDCFPDQAFDLGRVADVNRGGAGDMPGRIDLGRYGARTLGINIGDDDPGSLRGK
jgi:hypothetical protein